MFDKDCGSGGRVSLQLERVLIAWKSKEPQKGSTLLHTNMFHSSIFTFSSGITNIPVQ